MNARIFFVFSMILFSFHALIAQDKGKDTEKAEPVNVHARDRQHERAQNHPRQAVHREHREAVRHIQENEQLTPEEKKEELDLLRTKRRAALQEQQSGNVSAQERQAARSPQAWRQLENDLDLNEEQTEEVKRIDNNFRAQVKSLELNKSLSPEEKSKQISQFRKERNDAIRVVLNDEQRVKFQDYRRLQSRGSN